MEVGTLSLKEEIMGSNYLLQVMVYQGGRKIYDCHCQSITHTKDGQLICDFGSYDKRFKRSEYDNYFVLVDYNA